jgi:hypothetical protein
MSKRVYLLISFALLMALTGRALATDYNWVVTSGNGLWTDANNWSPKGVPVIQSSDKAKINSLPGPTINSGMAVECTWLVVSDGFPGAIHITGGTFNVAPFVVGSDSWTILGYSPSDNGTITMDGGVMTTANRVFVGFQGTGTINMNGGTMNIGGLFGIGYCDSGSTTGKGYVHLNGGTINAANGLSMRIPAACTGLLDLSGGTLTVNGDQTGSTTIISGYINNGWITAYGGLGTITMSYNSSTNKTTLIGVTDSTRARLPYPANNAVNVPPYVELNWVQSSAAITQDIYLGTDSNSVLNATPSTAGIYKTSVANDVNSYTPAGLALNTTYYWRVDEINGANVVKGTVWQFKVAAYSVVDDFETYADTAGMLASWSNGSTGATLSLTTANGHDNVKSMKFDYNNGNTPLYSEAQIASINPDWTVAGVAAMDIWYKGSAGNVAQPMYTALEDNDNHPIAVIVNNDANAVKAADWQVWHVRLADFAGINLTNVKKLYIGFGSRTTPVVGGAGTLYIDDIKLYPSRCLAQPSTDLNADCVVDFKDFAVFAGNWMGQQ